MHHRGSIITFDSLDGEHTEAQKILRQYLVKEAFIKKGLKTDGQVLCGIKGHVSLNIFPRGTSD